MNGHISPTWKQVKQTKIFGSEINVYKIQGGKKLFERPEGRETYFLGVVILKKLPNRQ